MTEYEDQGLTLNDYNNIHSWLKNNYGSANHCENTECERKSIYFEWALIEGKKYSYDRNNFKQLCRDCHRKYDYKNKKRSEATKKKMSDAQIAKRKKDKEIFFGYNILKFK
jgi:hypothetical protein